MMLKKAKNKGKVSEEEVVRMKEVLEEGREKGERIPKKDEEVGENLKVEFKKLKIENKRTPSNKKNEDLKEEANVNYNDAEQISRYQNWENLRNLSDYRDYRRSKSRAGMWKNSKGNYRKCPHREPSRPRGWSNIRKQMMNSGNRRESYRTNDRPKNEEKEENAEAFKEMTKNMAAIADQLKRVTENQDKMANTKVINLVKIVPEEEKNKETKEELNPYQRIIFDTGCPSSISGNKWINEYLKYMEIEKDDLELEECSEKFTFGPSEIYEAKEKIKIPIKMKTNEEIDKFKETEIETFIIKSDEIPLLCGKNTMNDWSTKVDLIKEIVTIETDEKIDNIKTSYTEEGHLVTKLFKMEPKKKVKEILFVRKIKSKFKNEIDEEDYSILKHLKTKDDPKLHKDNEQNKLKFEDHDKNKIKHHLNFDKYDSDPDDEVDEEEEYPKKVNDEN
jgi:hypothetical protein